MTADQWTDFRRLFPTAAAWIDARDLENEYRSLHAEKSDLTAQASASPLRGAHLWRFNWITERLAEFDPLMSARTKEQTP